MFLKTNQDNLESLNVQELITTLSEAANFFGAANVLNTKSDLFIYNCVLLINKCTTDLFSQDETCLLNRMLYC